MVVELGHRADRAARTSHRIRLVDRNRRQDAFDAVHLGFVHAVEELSRIGRERFDVATLSFGVERVEGERTFARAAHARDHGQLAGVQGQVQVLEVILASASDADGGVHDPIIKCPAAGDEGRRIARVVFRVI